jgi:hypothetical protein
VEDELRNGNSECWDNLAGDESSKGRKLQFNSHWEHGGMPAMRTSVPGAISSVPYKKD